MGFSDSTRRLSYTSKRMQLAMKIAVHTVARSSSSSTRLRAKGSYPSLHPDDGELFLGSSDDSGYSRSFFKAPGLTRRPRVRNLACPTIAFLRSENGRDFGASTPNRQEGAASSTSENEGTEASGKALGRCEQEGCWV